MNEYLFIKLENDEEKVTKKDCVLAVVLYSTRKSLKKKGKDGKH